MAGLRELIEDPVLIVEDEFEYDGETYKFSGSADANLFAETILLTPPQLELFAKHWTTVCETPFSPGLVKRVKMVHRTLVSPPGEPEYDETEIARLCCKQGALFLQMLMSAYKVLGLSKEEQEEVSALDRAAAGNSSGSEATS